MPSNAATRVAWVDQARGVGIVLVVFGHVWRGVRSAGLLPLTEWTRAVDGIVYAFHMPLFFFLAGIFFHESLTRRAVVASFRFRAERLLWPLALWTWIYFALKGLAGTAANVPLAWTDFPFLPLPPREQFWFLWALFVIQSLATVLWALRPWRRVPAIGFWSVALALTLIAYIVRPPEQAIPLLGPAAWFAPFFALGALVGAVPALLRWRAPLMVVALALPLSAGLIVLADPVPAAKLVLQVVAVISCIGLIRGMAPALPTWLGAGLRALGLASMAIYVAHVIFSAGFRIGLVGLGVRDPAVHVVLGTLVGIVCPYALYVIARRWKLTRWLGF